jgi:hypothetical protein
MKAVLIVRLPVLCEPETALIPDHPPEAVHEVALVEFQEREEDDPEFTEVGLADNWTVGAADAVFTITVADWLADPADPVQVNVNVAFAVKAPVLCEPEFAFVPDHAPDAVQELEFVELHVSVEEDPEMREVGLTVS